MWVSDQEKVAILMQILGGWTGHGHFMGSSGRIDCPHCHHPGSHDPTCVIGGILERKDFQGYIEANIELRDAIMEGICIGATGKKPPRARLLTELVKTMQQLLDQRNKLHDDNMQLSTKLFTLKTEYGLYPGFKGTKKLPKKKAKR